MPTGVGSPPYSTLVGLRGSNEPWPPSDAWSLIVEKIDALDPYTWEAEVRYQSEHAPAGQLAPGRDFELYEGGKVVAVGRLL
jgi:hypothetical protein